jgi:hypothetical protein
MVPSVYIMSLPPEVHNHRSHPSQTELQCSGCAITSGFSTAVSKCWGVLAGWQRCVETLGWQEFAMSYT